MHMNHDTCPKYGPLDTWQKISGLGRSKTYEMLQSAHARRKAGVDVDVLAARLQDEGAVSFVKSWNELMGVIASKSADLAKVA